MVILNTITGIEDLHLCITGLSEIAFDQELHCFTIFFVLQFKHTIKVPYANSLGPDETLSCVILVINE